MSEVFKKDTVKTNPLLKLTLLPNMKAKGQLAKMKRGKYFSMDDSTRLFRSPDLQRLKTSNWYKQHNLAEMALILRLCCVPLSKVFSPLYASLSPLYVLSVKVINKLEWTISLNCVLLKHFTQQGINPDGALRLFLSILSSTGFSVALIETVGAVFELFRHLMMTLGV